MEQTGAVPLVIICAFLVGVGVAGLWAAPRIQRAGLRMMGEPRSRLAVWSRDVAASKTSLRSIRATGGMCIIVGVALVALLVTR